VALVQSILQKRRSKGHVAIDDTEPSLSIIKIILFAILPGAATMFGLFFTSVGLVWIDASYLQVLAIASVLFPSFFTIFVLKRSRGPIQFVALALVVVGAVPVIVAAAKHAGKNGALGAVLALGGHCITSTVPVLEDWFYGATSTSPTLIVGLEGLFATLISGPILLPLVGIKKGGLQGGGISEDTGETFKMLKASTPLILSIVGLVVLGVLHGTARAFIGPAATERALAIALLVQTVAVWAVQLILKAALGKGSYGKAHPLVGEELTKWSGVELVGFVIAAVGVLLNANAFKINKEQPASGLNDAPLI
jgi:hypothetical protein